jgi:hypothetical protein
MTDPHPDRAIRTHHCQPIRSVIVPGWVSYACPWCCFRWGHNSMTMEEISGNNNLSNATQ